MNDTEEGEVDNLEFRNVPNEVVNFLVKIFEDARLKVQTDTENRLLDLALVNLRYHPIYPLTPCCLSFRRNTSYYIVYNETKVELSDYHSSDADGGYDHFQTFRFCYYSDGRMEEEGDIDKFIYEFEGAMKLVAIVAVSEDE